MKPKGKSIVINCEDFDTWIRWYNIKNEMSRKVGKPLTNEEFANILLNIAEGKTPVIKSI